MALGRDVDPDETHGPSPSFWPGASAPVLTRALVHARIRLVAAPPDTVRAQSTGRGRLSHLRGRSLERTAATPSRRPRPPPYQETAR